MKHESRSERCRRFTVAFQPAGHPRLSFYFNNLPLGCAWYSECETEGMTFSLIVLAVQVAVLLFALVRESGKDARYSEAEKLGYRS